MSPHFYFFNFAISCSARNTSVLKSQKNVQKSCILYNFLQISIVAIKKFDGNGNELLMALFGAKKLSKI